MKLKDSTINIDDLHPKMRYIAEKVIDPWWQMNVGYELIITSGVDGKHNAQFSNHYNGCAVDVRTWTNAASGIQMDSQRRAHVHSSLLQHLENTFGSNFVQVLDEGHHFHIAFKPSFPVTWEMIRK